MRKMRFAALPLVFAFLLGSFAACGQREKNKYTAYYFDYFDTVTTVVGYADTKEAFDLICADITAEFAEYHRLYTIYNRYEGLNNLYTVNTLQDGAHSIVEVDPKIMDLLLYAKEVYQKTDRKTNIAMGSVLSIWHQYRNDGLRDPANAELYDSRSASCHQRNLSTNPKIHMLIPFPFARRICRMI